MTDKIYSQGELNKIFSHIPPRTIRFWVECGLVETVGQDSDRRGKHRKYDLPCLYQLGIVERLLSLNLPIEDVRRILQKFFHGKIEEKDESKTLYHMKDVLVLAWTTIGRSGGRVTSTFFKGNFQSMDHEVRLEINLPLIAEKVNLLIANPKA
jgi:DNA-binding transcriptional MerR regulator